MADPERAREILDALHELGIGLSIDDFGTGYSSLGKLKQLPVDEIKIDRSFVVGMANDRSDATVVRSTIDLARNLGLRVVAEGVEDLRVRDQLAGWAATSARATSSAARSTAPRSPRGRRRATSPPRRSPELAPEGPGGPPAFAVPGRQRAAFESRCVGDIEFLFALLVAVALLVSLARLTGLPYPIFLVLGGLGLGAIPGLPSIELEPDVVFLVFVPPLVHAAGYQASPRRLLRDARPIGLAAFVLVAVTIGAVAVAGHALVDELSWPAAFVLATVLAPTDLVAATAVFRRLSAPERVVNLVEGENLVNDGTALTAWRVAVGAAAAGVFSLGDAVVELRARRRRRHARRPRGRLRRRLAAPPPRRPARRDHGHAPHAVRPLHRRRAARGVGHPRRGGQRPVPRLEGLRAHRRRDAHRRLRVLGDPRLPARVAALRPRRPPVPGAARRPRRATRSTSCSSPACSSRS